MAYVKINGIYEFETPTILRARKVINYLINNNKKFKSKEFITGSKKECHKTIKRILEIAEDDMLYIEKFDFNIHKKGRLWRIVIKNKGVLK